MLLKAKSISIVKEGASRTAIDKMFAGLASRTRLPRRPSSKLEPCRPARASRKGSSRVSGPAA